MEIIRTPEEMQRLALSLREQGRRITLVPTMGALHRGHATLIDRAGLEGGAVVVSVFVNPTQFGPTEDLDRYPRPFDADCALAAEHGAAIVFAPEPRQMYPRFFSTQVRVNTLTETLCGAVRPGHFDGVATVVLKLFNIVQPHRAVFGQKDAQQAAVIARMVADLNLPVQLITVETVREPDGLALSSRNSYLSAGERREAPRIYAALKTLEESWYRGESTAEVLCELFRRELSRAPLLTLEYICLVDRTTMQPLEHIGDEGALVACACRTTGSNTRLIDNILLSPHAGKDLDSP